MRNKRIVGCERINNEHQVRSMSVRSMRVRSMTVATPDSTVYLPVALQYTMRALGSFFCSCNTVSPVLLGLLEPVGTRFLAL